MAHYSPDATNEKGWFHRRSISECFHPKAFSPGSNLLSPRVLLVRKTRPNTPHFRAVAKLCIYVGKSLAMIVVVVVDDFIMLYSRFVRATTK